MDWAIMVPWLLIAIGGIAAILKWTAELRSNTTYRAEQDKALAAKDAQLAAKEESVKSQLAQMQETLRAKDALIDQLKQTQFTESLRLITAQKDIYELDKKLLEKQMSDLSAKVDASASKINAVAKRREAMELGVTLIRNFAVVAEGQRRELLSAIEGLSSDDSEAAVARLKELATSESYAAAQRALEKAREFVNAINLPDEPGAQ
jgi:chromosome segregation ATPase